MMPSCLSCTGIRKDAAQRRSGWEKEAAVLYVLDMLMRTRTQTVVKEEDDRELLKLLADYISEKQGLHPGGDKEERRMRDILLESIRTSKQPELISRMADEGKSCMNQDYFG